MASTVAESCRITLVGPHRRADLAVPVEMPLAELMPQLTGFVVDGSAADPGGQRATSWAVQRLGEAPFGPAATAQSAGWLDGELLHLVAVEEPLPELDFDDVSDGVASALDREPGRWDPIAQRRLFVALAVFGAGLSGAALWPLPGWTGALALAVLAAVAVTWCIRAARMHLEPALLACGCLVAAAAGAAACVRAIGAAAVLAPGAVIAGALGAAFVAGLLLIARTTPLAPRTPVTPPLAIALAGVVSAVAAVADVGARLPLTLGAAVVGTVAVWAALVVPRFAVRAAGIQLPQLPRTAAEMQDDVEPLPAAVIVRLTARADAYLSAGVIAIALVVGPAIALTAQRPGWPALLLAAVLTTLVALRAREVFAIPQRVALVAAACVGVLAVLSVLVGESGPAVLVVVAVVAAGGCALAVAAARRAPGRRMRPRWRQTAIVLEGLLAASCLPLLLGVLGVYAWARGLAG